MIRMAMTAVDAFCVETCLVIFFYVLCTSTKNRDRRTTYFLGIVASAVCMGVFDIMGHVLSRPVAGTTQRDSILFLLNTGYFLMQECGVLSCYSYVICLVEKRGEEAKTRNRIRIAGIMVILAMACNIINYWTRDFYEIEKTIFVAKKYYPIMLMTTVVLYVLVATYLYSIREEINKVKLLKLLVYIGTPIVAGVAYMINSSTSYMVPAAAVSSVAILISFQSSNRNRLLRESMEKVTFLTDMSHEIRTPINSVIGMNEMILREAKEEPIRKYAMDVKNSANSLLSIINDVLDVSKIETGELDIEETEYRFGDMVEDLSTMFRIRAEEKGLSFVLKVDETLPSSLYGDEIRIRQILINLLSNAVKYTQKGQVVLEITGEKKDDVETLLFAVSDTGIGLKEEDIPKLFAKYMRLDEKKNRNIEGTGLGISIVANLLRLMNTELKVESVYGQGSRFFFELEQPIVSAEPVGNIIKVSQKKASSYQYKELFTAPEAKVLIVDDNDMNRRVICGLLKKTKVQVTEVSSGAACLELVRKERFDIIFMDHYMPEMDGIETFHELRKMEDNQSREAKVVMLTANALVGAEEEYMEKGFDSFLSKPVRPVELEQCMLECLPAELIGKAQEEVIQWDQLKAFDPDCMEEYKKNPGVFGEILKDFYEETGEMLSKLKLFCRDLTQVGEYKNYEANMMRLIQAAEVVGAYSVAELAYFSLKAVQVQAYEEVKQLHECLEREIKLYRNEIFMAL